jgi:hypothetical protein
MYIYVLGSLVKSLNIIISLVHTHAHTHTHTHVRVNGSSSMQMSYANVIQMSLSLTHTHTRAGKWNILLFHDNTPSEIMILCTVSSSLICTVSSSLICTVSSSLICKVSSSLICTVSSSLICTVSLSLICRASSSLIVCHHEKPSSAQCHYLWLCIIMKTQAVQVRGEVQVYVFHIQAEHCGSRSISKQGSATAEFDHARKKKKKRPRQPSHVRLLTWSCHSRCIVSISFRLHTQQMPYSCDKQRVSHTLRGEKLTSEPRAGRHGGRCSHWVRWLQPCEHQQHGSSAFLLRVTLHVLTETDATSKFDLLVSLGDEMHTRARAMEGDAWQPAWHGGWDNSAHHANAVCGNCNGHRIKEAQNINGSWKQEGMARIRWAAKTWAAWVTHGMVWRGGPWHTLDYAELLSRSMMLAWRPGFWNVSENLSAIWVRKSLIQYSNGMHDLALRTERQHIAGKAGLHGPFSITSNDALLRRNHTQMFHLHGIWCVDSNGAHICHLIRWHTISPRWISPFSSL